MRKLLFVVIVSAACGARSGSGPAWPKTLDAETDGGESLSPREAKQVAAALEKSEESKPAAAVAEAKPEAKAAEAKPDAKPDAAQPPAIEDSIMGEEILIEIDE